MSDYTQCRLEKYHMNMTRRLVSFVPSKYAKLHTYIKLKDRGDGWYIVHVGNTIDNIPDCHKQIRGHRKNTGDSLPKIKES